MMRFWLRVGVDGCLTANVIHQGVNTFIVYSLLHLNLSQISLFIIIGVEATGYLSNPPLFLHEGIVG